MAEGLRGRLLRISELGSVETGLIAGGAGSPAGACPEGAAAADVLGSPPCVRRVATKIFLAFAVSLLAFAAVAGFGIARVHEVRRDLRLLSGGYLAMTRIAAQLEVKEWVATRALEA